MVNTKCADGEFFCKDSCIGCLPYSLGGYMTFFHASQIKGIQVLEPRISNHNLRYHYPEFDATQKWAKVMSQRLSDTLLTQMEGEE